MSQAEFTAAKSVTPSRRASDRLGVTVAICTYNGAKRLPATLGHLKAQQVPAEIPWEVIVVDNASTDDTAEVARNCWRGCEKAPLRVVREPRLGKSNACERAFREARFEIVSIVDDDNLVGDGWVTAASEIFSSHPQIGAAGGLVFPKFEAPPPPWWYDYGHYFALLVEVPREPPKSIDGAGLTVRKKAWDELMRSGFQFCLSTFRGRRLSCGEDTQLTIALQQAGWQLRIDPRLRMLHFIEARRLNWKYFRRMARGYASSWVFLYALLSDPADLEKACSVSWQRQLLRWLRSSMLRPHEWWHWMFSNTEGDVSVIELERALGCAFGLFTYRRELRRLLEGVRKTRMLPTTSRANAPLVSSQTIIVEAEAQAAGNRQ